jgi:hypothetical protein
MNRKTVIIGLIGVGLLYLLALSQPGAQRSPAVATPAVTPANEFQPSTGQAEAEPPAASSASGRIATEGSARSFAGYGCSGDCSGHEAGYKWAEEHGIDDEGDCDAAGDNSNSPSFAEGCKAYVNGDSSDDDSGKTEGQDADQEDENADR